MLFCYIITGTCLCFDCTGKADGVYEAACQSFTKCINGTASLVECHLPQVVNEETMDCDKYASYVYLYVKGKI